MLTEFLTGSGIVLLFFAICVVIVGLLRTFTKIEDEIFRKLLHCILLWSLVIWTFTFETWYLAALSALAFAGICYPALSIMGKIPGFSKFMNERKGGEMKKSLILVFVMYAIVATFSWGMMGERMIAMASIFAWGYGDAAAALIGKRFGKHKITAGHVEGKKSIEGTVAMYLVSFGTVLLILLVRGGMPWYAYGIVAGITAIVSSSVELFSVQGRDTITCPLAAMSVLIPMLTFFGGLV